MKNLFWDTVSKSILKIKNLKKSVVTNHDVIPVLNEFWHSNDEYHSLCKQKNEKKIILKLNLVNQLKKPSY